MINNEQKIDQVLLEEIYENFREDYIAFWILFSIIKNFYRSKNKANYTKIVLKYLEFLVKKTYIEIGEFINDEKGLLIFSPWRISSDEKFNKIKLLWKEIDFKEPDIGEVECYFKME